MPTVTANSRRRSLVSFLEQLPAGEWTMLLVLLLLGTTVVPSRADHYLHRHQILLLQSNHPGYLWSDKLEAAIRADLTKADNSLDLSVEYLDTKRFQSEDSFPVMEHFLLGKYQRRQPDVVIAADDAALQFLLPRRKLLFPQVPLVFCGINDFSDDLIAGQTRITGVVENPDVTGTINLILRLQPQTRRIAFVSDSTESGRINRQRFQKATLAYQGRVTFLDLSDLPFAELQARLRQLPTDTAILHTTLFRDRNGETLSPEGSIALLTEHTSLPFYGMWEHGLGRDGVGGLITSPTLQGQSAADMALRILHGTLPETIPVERSTLTRPMFNYSALQRYRIDEALLPPGSMVRNRPVSFYQSYTKLVWVVGVGFILLGALVIALLVNIRIKKRTVALLKERKNQLKQVLETMPVGVCLVDRHGRSVMANSAGIAIWGGACPLCNVGYAPLKGWRTVNGAQLTADDWGIVRAVLYGETVLDELIDIEAFDGERKTIAYSATPLRDTDGAIIGGLLVVQDVSERLRTEHTLQALANEWQNTFDALSDAIVLLDKNFRILHYNRAFLRTVDKAPEEIVSRHCWELVHHGGAPVGCCPFARMLESGRSETFEYQDSDRWWEVRVDPILDDDGKLYGAIHIMADITLRKRAELDRQALIVQLEERNAELEQFTYSVSHDLRTPLVTISGFAGQLRSDLALSDHECVAIDLDFIESSTNQMGVLLDNLLHLARSGRVVGDPQPVNLASAAREALELAGGILVARTTRLEFADDLPPVPGDVARLREVFQNLIENAAKFSVSQPWPEITIGGRTEDDQVHCWVRDNGIGIPPQYLERIFGLFERLDHSAEGTGVGLALARRIVEKHGGRIWAESAGEGTGSTFHFTLPR